MAEPFTTEELARLVEKTDWASAIDRDGVMIGILLGIHAQLELMNKATDAAVADVSRLLDQALEGPAQ